MRPLIVYGGSQAHAMAIVLKRVGGVGDRFDVVYVSDGDPAALESAPLRDCAILLEQRAAVPFPAAERLPADCRSVSFPTLDFHLLWPLEQPNPYNDDGKFPYGNRFILSAVEQGRGKEEILEAYRDPDSPAQWPDLDKLFVSETARLGAKDAACTVKMSSYILKYFRRQRLFVAPLHPSDKLLAELMRRTLRAAFATDHSVHYAHVEETLASLGARDMLGVLEVPVHPRVARHFDLAWYDADYRYNFFDEETLSHDEYFGRMIESAQRALPAAAASAASAGPAKPTLIVYGNCQAEAVHAILHRHPRIRDHFRPIYLRSFDHPVDGWQQLPAADVAACAVLFEQHDRREFPHRELLPEDCRTVKFPAMDLNVLWPFNRVNPYNRPEPPDFPFGRFAYGDSVIVDCIERGMRAREILEYYLERWDEYAPNLDRLLSLERARLAHRDAQCDIKMGHYVIEHFSQQRLFWTVNHPTNALVCQLIVDLMNTAFADEPPVTRDEIDATRNQYFEADPLGAISVPVHPKVAEHFHLEWYDPKERYVSFGGKRYTYVSYFETMIKTSLAFRLTAEAAARRAAATAQAAGRP